MAQAPISYRDLFAIADLPAMLVATTVARLANRMFSLVIVLYALEHFSSPILAGWLGFAAVVPGLLVSPFAGALLDRVGPVGAIAIDLASSAVLVLVLTVAGVFGWATPSVLLVLVSVFSLTNPLGRAGIRTLFPRLVPKQALDRVNALDTAIYAVTDVIGPAVAGLLLGFLGASNTLLTIAILFAVGALCVARVRRPERLVSGRASFLAETWDGIRIVFREPTLRALALSYSLYQVTWGVLVVVVPVLAYRSLPQADANSAAGLLWAACGVAGGAGALVAGHLQTTGRERTVLAAGMIVTAIAAWPIAAQFGFTGLVLGLMITGASSGPIDVGLLTLRQRRTDPARLGRVLSVSMSLNIAGYPLGSALAGILIGHSLTATFLLAAVASLLGCLALIAIPAEGQSAGSLA